MIATNTAVITKMTDALFSLMNAKQNLTPERSSWRSWRPQTRRDQAEGFIQDGIQWSSAPSHYEVLGHR
jgi:hypothetical protein